MRPAFIKAKAGAQSLGCEKKIRQMASQAASPSRVSWRGTLYWDRAAPSDRLPARLSSWLETKIL
jgi:hypothetical protein